MKLTFPQKIRSYFYPLIVRRGSSTFNPVLDLLYYRGQWQLATEDALYSDGIYYRPLVAAFKALKNELVHFQNVLVLGTGLGSAVQILHRHGIHPDITLVELDEVILNMAIELMPSSITANIKPVCADAQLFLNEDQTKYSLIIVDIFRGRTVPEFVLSDGFVAKCKDHLQANGILVFNYMIKIPGDELIAKAALGAAFKNVKEISLGLNRVYIARV